MPALGTQLLSDLRSAFVSEAMTAQRYAYFAEIAEIEGYLELAALLRELLQATVCAAHGHLDYLQLAADPATGRPIGDTPLNLAAALAGELAEATGTYPQLSQAAHAEGQADVASWLETLQVLKQAHVARLEAALASLPTTGSGEPRPEGPDGSRG